MIEFLTANWDTILTYAMAIFGLLAIVARFTPTPKDDAIFGFIYDAISSMTPNDRAKKVEQGLDKVNELIDTAKDIISDTKKSDSKKEE